MEPLGASQELKLDKVLYQEAGEYRCVTPSRDTIGRLDPLRNALSVELIVTGMQETVDCQDERLHALNSKGPSN